MNVIDSKSLERDASEKQVPTFSHPALEPASIETALTGGDDYEILCSVPAARAAAFEAGAAAAGVTVTRIGVAQGDQPIFIDADGKERSFARGSYSHF
ncbi:MAG TPA: hypothetical protein VG271_15950 [Beijerinckiaceae bacterium]|jgi:thiamine-monophosphate kinase|nr:hypothetical protein [Beijerinckiaceae bacterium]